MPTSTWGDPESYNDDAYPSALLKYLLRQMIVHFAAQGACIALYDESIGQMRISMHLRLSPSINPAGLPFAWAAQEGRTANRRSTVRLENDIVGQEHQSAHTSLLDEIQEVLPPEGEPFIRGTAYPMGQDLIGYTWQKNEVLLLRLEEYLNSFHKTGPLPLSWEALPSSYLAIPIQEAVIPDDMGRKRPQAILGVIVLYQTNFGPGFQQKHRSDAPAYVEHIALYLQNARLQRSQRRTSEYLRCLQEISTAFPKSVKLSDLVESMYQFTKQVVNVSSMLLTLYDRDTERIYDVFASLNGTRVDDLIEQPMITQAENRPVWWQVTQHEKRALQFSPAQDVAATNQYQELLSGAWGDQRYSESFLFLPMKMFNRVIGSLSVTSMRPRAYQPAEIQVLETMLQLVTVSIENAKLYERDRLLLHEARQRETQLATINSALQSFSSVLNATELLNKFVDAVAAIVNVDVCAFFQPSPDKAELIAQALHAPSNVRMVDDGSGLPNMAHEPSKHGHHALINMIHLPFAGTFLEQLVDEGFFYLDAPKLEELAQKSQEGGAIFLQEMFSQQMLMIPMTHQTEFIGMLAVSTPAESRFFRPKDIGTLLAISAQAVNAIHNAQLSEQREEAYAELQRMDRLKDEFLVTASHELRTPLSAIIGYASLLKRQSARIMPQQCLRFATKIGTAAQQLSDLLGNMTEAAKMGAIDKKLVLDLEPVEIFSAAEMAASMLVLNIEQKITLNVNPDLWVRAAAQHLRQVLSNLLENAAKYSLPHSSITLSAYVTTLAEIEPLLPANLIDHLIKYDDTSVVLVRVQDQGEGILPEDQQRIFEKFVRAPRSLTTPVRGSGLGLYICRRYIEAMDGRLWLEQSIPNEGSIFSFYLPRIDPPIETRERDEREQ